MELSGSKIKKCLIFSQEKAFLIFRKISIHSSRKQTKSSPRRFLIFQENESSWLQHQKFSYIFSRENLSYISGNETLSKKVFIF